MTLVVLLLLFAVSRGASARNGQSAPNENCASPGPCDATRTCSKVLSADLVDGVCR